ncbi:MAG: hypothetical protein HYV09_01810 [Deltaproteobacteria bacterium]|nr:hypothetical protein [Deltaproteobacteria bacterium]
MTSTPIPAVPPVIEGDARDAARALFGVPPKPGRVIGSIDATTNADPQVNAAGVLAFTGANGRVFTVFAGPSGLRVTGAVDLGPVRSLATDGPHVCASDRVSLRCADVDGGGVAVRTVSAGETTGLWGGQGVLLRASTNGLETSLEASEDGFVKTRPVEIPRRRKVVAAMIESPSRWTVVMLPTEGTIKPRYGLTVDAGRSAIADFGALDRTGWSNGDRLWSDQLVTGPFSTEMIVAERGEKQSSIALPWSAAGAFAFARRALFLFGRGVSGNGGFLLLEFPSRRVMSITPSGAHPFIAAGRVGGALVAVTNEGKVLAWE